MKKAYTKQITGTFDFLFDMPFTLREMPDNKVGFEVEPSLNFCELLIETPECNDFRQLMSDKTWVAYSTVLGPEGEAIRAIGKTIYDALVELRKKLNYEN